MEPPRGDRMALFFIILISISCFYWLVAMANALHFFHQEPLPSTFTPPISVLKPVRGLDPGAYENFSSFVRQDYPEFEVIFGVLEQDDPAVPVIRHIQEDFPEKRILFYVAPPLGANRKTAILSHLVQMANYDYLVCADSDIRVKPNFLKTLSAFFRDEKVGLVGSLYRSLARNIWSKVESLLISTFLIPSGVLGFRLFGLRYAFGAALAFRRQALEDIGGFSTFKDHVADDHEIARLVHKAGWQVLLAPCVVSNLLNDVRWSEFWTRQLRWMRVAFVCRRKEYPGILLTFAFPLAIIFAFSSSFTPISLWFLVVSFGVRLTAGYLMAELLDHREMKRWLYLILLSDLFFVLLWVMAFFSKRVSWRQEDYLLLSDGRMLPVENGGEYREEPKI
jgi:ceramide glucosyltransferase